VSHFDRNIKHIKAIVRPAAQIPAHDAGLTSVWVSVNYNPT